MGTLALIQEGIKKTWPKAQTKNCEEHHHFISFTPPGVRPHQAPYVLYQHWAFSNVLWFQAGWLCNGSSRLGLLKGRTFRTRMWGCPVCVTCWCGHQTRAPRGGCGDLTCVLPASLGNLGWRKWQGARYPTVCVSAQPVQSFQQGREFIGR